MAKSIAAYSFDYTEPMKYAHLTKESEEPIKIWAVNEKKATQISARFQYMKRKFADHPDYGEDGPLSFGAIRVWARGNYVYLQHVDYCEDAVLLRKGLEKWREEHPDLASQVDHKSFHLPLTSPDEEESHE